MKTTVKGEEMKNTMLIVIISILLIGCERNISPQETIEPQKANITIQDSGGSIVKAGNDKLSTMSSRIYIDLDYLGSVPNADLSEFYERHPQIDKAAEFTWWEHYSGKNIALAIFRKYNVVLPCFDSSDKDVVISFGRKLTKLYYNSTPVQAHFYYARPVFEKEYEANTIYIYLINPVDLMRNETWMNDMSKFNEEGLIPYEEELIE